MPSKAEQVRALIYGEPLDQLPPGFPSKRDCMRFFMWCVQEQRVAENNAIRLNDTSKTKIRDDFVTQLEVHWSNQSPKKTLMITRDINREVKPLIDLYWKLQDLGAAKLEDPGWINDGPWEWSRLYCNRNSKTGRGCTRPSIVRHLHHTTNGDRRS